MLIYVLLCVSLLRSDRCQLALLRYEMSRFPTYGQCVDWCNRADQHLYWIDQRIALFPFDRDYWLAYREQVVSWKGVWEALRFARAPATILTDWERLKVVRRAIGEENYRRGYVPPPIAEWLDQPK